MISYLIYGFGSRHTRQTHIVLGFSTQNIKFLPVDFHLKRVAFDLSGGFGFADLVSKVPFLGWLPHLEHSCELIYSHNTQSKRLTLPPPN